VRDGGGARDNRLRAKGARSGTIPESLSGLCAGWPSLPGGTATRCGKRYKKRPAPVTGLAWYYSPPFPAPRGNPGKETAILKRVFICNSGLEANEARQNWRAGMGALKLNGAYEVITTSTPSMAFPGHDGRNSQAQLQDLSKPLPIGLSM